MRKQEQRLEIAPLGLKRGSVILCGYSKEWPRLFRVERDLLKDGLGKLAIRISHVGSTAVPGLCAKPILDIMVEVSSLARTEKACSRLERCGYKLKPRKEDPVPGRLFCSKDVNGLRCFHLHVTEAGSAFCKEHLRFRNVLRKDPKRAQAYARLKRRLSKQFPDDRNAYINGKAKFISEAVFNREG